MLARSGTQKWPGLRELRFHSTHVQSLVQSLAQPVRKLTAHPKASAS
jgi:hypothetical protein